MINNSDQIGVEKDILDVPHEALVVDNKDPSFKRRIKVSIPGLIEGSNLPWCLPQLGSHFGGSSNYGSIEIPRVGSSVVVIFPFKDIHLPFYVGNWSLNPVPEEFRANYPDMHGFKNASGTVSVFDEKTGTYTFSHASGFKFTINKDSSFSLVSKGADIDLKDVFNLLAKSFSAKVSENSVFDTKELKSTGEVVDKVRAMSGDREIYDSHIHTTPMGESGPPSPRE